MASQIEFHAMGTTIQVILDSGKPQAIKQLREVPAWFEAWEECFSRFRSTSELSQMNRTNGSPVQLSEPFWQVLELSLEAERWTGGMVTPLVLDSMLAVGYIHSFEENQPYDFFPRSEYVGQVMLADRIQLFPGDRIAILPGESHLDFGGFAKGWAAWQTSNLLSEYGPVMVDAGGDIALSGLPEDSTGWLIGIEHPLGAEEQELTLSLSTGGVATSGKNRRKWKRGGVQFHHLIDPFTGMSAISNVLSATVIGPNVMQAEIAAKMVFLSGSVRGIEWINNQPGFAALLYLDDGSVQVSNNFYQLTGYEYE